MNKTLWIMLAIGVVLGWSLRGGYNHFRYGYGYGGYYGSHHTVIVN